ncbi:uncharacterized protein LOC143422673 [Xylocopa sonorina]|uniref:uncharacterized protein LOC143422673 n=1 Tax=Xylocopa sonorina TaxID=1818115 RepID=UPI00403B0A67
MQIKAISCAESVTLMKHEKCLFQIKHVYVKVFTFLSGTLNVYDVMFASVASVFYGFSKMDISTSTQTNKNVPQSNASRKFHLSILKWLNRVPAHDDSNNEEMYNVRHRTKPDVPTLASFLQAVGFKLLSFEKYNDPEIQKKHENDAEKKSEQGTLTITMECDVSNMKAVLELEGITCHCPNPDHVKEASFWSISGTGPGKSTDTVSMQKVEETGSNLLPRLPKDVIQLLYDVSYKLFDIIMCEPDVNRNTDSYLDVSHNSNQFRESKILKTEIGVTRSHTQPELHRSTDSIDSKSQNKDTTFDLSINHTASSIPMSKSVLERQKTWDIETVSLDGEPRPSPPKLTSSPTPITELCKSLEPISLHNQIENAESLTDCILEAQQRLEKALKILVDKDSITSKNKSPNHDNDAMSVRSAPDNIMPAVVISPCKSTRSDTVTNVKSLTRFSHLMLEQQSQVKTISQNVIQTPKIQRCIESTLSKSVTRTNIKNQKDNSKSQIRRSSFYIPSSANFNTKSSKPSDVKRKAVTSGKYSENKLNITIDSNTANRNLMESERLALLDQQVRTSPKSELLNTTITCTSTIKPPTNISKAIPVRIRPVTPSKANPKLRGNILKK